ncbi:hypothetical protein [Brevibacterium antiquum]|uniref:Uncharacterized protein n=1 Tax=Brevibacterium antiquum CNRZ 918 TaxID=1255637 RepID=A0A2H1IZ62_9MICO|nr:hypothetical protein [Brevibacterium antiquum]SMX80282.1 hypothetical protein BANT918_01221 [Brevibacterium antiquum CNRZ 918]
MDQDLPSVQDLSLSPPGLEGTAAVLSVREALGPMVRAQARRTPALDPMVQRQRLGPMVQRQRQGQGQRQHQGPTAQRQHLGPTAQRRVPMVLLPASKGQHQASSAPQVQQLRSVLAPARGFSVR